MYNISEVIILIICPNCKTENEDDAKFCKNCGHYFLEEENNKKDNNKRESKKKYKVKYKTKTKNKTKIKKEKAKTPKNKQSNDKQKSSIFTKILLLFFILLSIGLLVITSILCYHYYEENNIEVPNVIGYSYEEATVILDTANLSYEMKEVETTNQDEVGIVIKQSKKGGSKNHENAIITLTVGILDNHVTVPGVIGMTLEEATSTLNKNNISYRIEYEETTDEENNTIINQSIRAGKKIENTEIITITVARNTNNNSNTDNNETNDEKTDDNNKVNESTNQGQEKNLQN